MVAIERGYVQRDFLGHVPGESPYAHSLAWLPNLRGILERYLYKALQTNIYKSANIGLTLT